MNSISSFGPGLNSVPKHYILTTSTELKSGLINPNKFVISRYISASHLSIINQSKDYSWSTSVKMPCHPIPFEIIIQGEMNTLPSIESMPMPFDQISGSLGTTQIPGVRNCLWYHCDWYILTEARCLASGVRPVLPKVKKCGLFQEEPAALVVPAVE